MGAVTRLIFVVMLMVCGNALAQPITSFPNANLPFTGSEYLPMIQNGKNVKTTLGSITLNSNLSGATVTASGTSITNSLAVWTGYLAGLPNPNPVIFGGVGGLGNFSITPVTPSIIPTVPQVFNFIQPTSSGGGGVKNAVENQVVITGAPTSFWWVELNQLTYNGTGGGSAQHVAGYNQTTRDAFSSGGAANNPQLWASVDEMDDFTGQPSSATNATLSVEVDLTGHNVDNANNRIMVSGAVGPAHDNTNAFEASNGYYLTLPSGGYVKTGYGLGGSYTVAALDLRYALSYAQGATSLTSRPAPTVTAPVAASVTVPVSNVMPFTSDIFSRDIDAGSFTTMVHFSDGQIATETGYTLQGTGPTPSGTITLSAPITLAMGVTIYNSSNALWLATGQTIALDTNGATMLSSNGSKISSSAPLGLSTYTVATLPSCVTASANSMAAVTDATTPTYDGTLTGGGTVHVPVFCDGTTWTSH